MNFDSGHGQDLGPARSRVKWRNPQKVPRRCCRRSESASLLVTRGVAPQFFAANPDSQIARFQTPNGIYEPGCGLDQVVLSWSHDEYIYHVAKDYLPPEGLAMLRYHSFYPWHREGAYDQFCTPADRALMPWVLKFNTYDLYTKSHEAPDVAKLKPYYEELIREFFPEKVRW